VGEEKGGNRKKKGAKDRKKEGKRKEKKKTREGKEKKWVLFTIQFLILKIFLVLRAYLR